MSSAHRQNPLVQLALATSARLHVGDWFRPRRRPAAHVLLFHRFFSRGESRQTSLDRLHRQLDWLRSKYQPMSLTQLEQGLRTGQVPDRGVVLTTDDGLLDLLGVVDVFKAHEFPLSAFVCAGWTASASQGVGEDLLARAVAGIQWFEGSGVSPVALAKQSWSLSPGARADHIDRLLTLRNELQPDELEAFCLWLEKDKPPRQVCTWDEIRSLVDQGVEVGAHSVSHVWMSETSPLRLNFEVTESQRLCELFSGQCAGFAYPHGMHNTHNTKTYQQLKQAGYPLGFLTHSDYITASADPWTLPRVSMPDDPLSPEEFKVRAGGAGVGLRRVKVWLGRS